MSRLQDIFRETVCQPIEIIPPRFLLTSSVLTSVYNFCKENLITGHVVTEALPRLRVSSPTEIRSVITFAEPVPGQTVAVEQLD